MILALELLSERCHECLYGLAPQRTASEKGTDSRGDLCHSSVDTSWLLNAPAARFLYDENDGSGASPSYPGWFNRNRFFQSYVGNSGDFPAGMCRRSLRDYPSCLFNVGSCTDEQAFKFSRRCTAPSGGRIGAVERGGDVHFGATTWKSFGLRHDFGFGPGWR